MGTKNIEIIDNYYTQDTFNTWEENKVINQMNDKKYDKKNLAQRLLILASFMKQHDITFTELLTKNIFSSVPYQKKQSKQFIRACQNGIIDEVRMILSQCKYIVYDVDCFFLTGLHWAVKRGHLQLCDILLKHKSHVNSLDFNGRSPLFFAMSHGYLEIVQLLIYNKADPFLINVEDPQISKNFNGQIETEYNKSKKVNQNSLYLIYN